MCVGLKKFNDANIRDSQINSTMIPARFARLESLFQRIMTTDMPSVGIPNKTHRIFRTPGKPVGYCRTAGPAAGAAQLSSFGKTTVTRVPAHIFEGNAAL